MEDLAKDSSLSQMARIGVKHYKDLILRIPRDEVAAAEKYVQNVGKDLCPEVCSLCIYVPLFSVVRLFVLTGALFDMSPFVNVYSL